MTNKKVQCPNCGKLKATITGSEEYEEGLYVIWYECEDCELIANLE